MASMCQGLPEGSPKETPLGLHEQRRAREGKKTRLSENVGTERERERERESLLWSVEVNAYCVAGTSVSGTFSATVPQVLDRFR